MPALTDAAIRKTKCGPKLWRLKYRLNGKVKRLALTQTLAF
jgi:hypothetical protein